MNEHTTKLFDDARSNHIVEILNDLEFDDININASDHNNQTLLHYAAVYNQPTIIVKILANFNANINALDNYHRTPLHYASSYEHYECVRA